MPYSRSRASRRSARGWLATTRTGIDERAAQQAGDHRLGHDARADRGDRRVRKGGHRPEYSDAVGRAPLANATIATVGSGVMAEAMIAGLLRGALVEPGRVVASHPRAERREALEREYGIRTVADNLDAVRTPT